MVEVPADLKHAARQHRLVPFVGAGLSAFLGLPTWSDLVSEVAKELDLDPEIASLYGDFLQIAEYFSILKDGIGPLRSRLDRRFNSEEIDVGSSKPHMLLPELHCPAIYTTNWDNLIERAFDQAEVPYNKIVTVHDLLEANSKYTNIVKFHGDFSRDESLVFTESNYFNRLELESPLDIRLRADMLGRTLLFIGYSFNDINIRYMWFRLMRSLEGRVNNTTFAYIVSYLPNPVFSILSSQSRRISVIDLDPLDFLGGLSYLIEVLAGEAQRG